LVGEQHLQFIVRGAWNNHLDQAQRHKSPILLVRGHKYSTSHR
jgi:hypothetical protein